MSGNASNHENVKVSSDLIMESRDGVERAPPSADNKKEYVARPAQNRPHELSTSTNVPAQAGQEVSPSDNVSDLEAARPTPTGPLYSVFTKRQKQYIVFMTAWAGLFSPISAQIYFPALNSLAADLKVSNTLINLTLTSYMIFQGLAPTVFGDLADMTGRRPSYILGFVIYIGANIGLALQNNYAALFVLRCLQSTGSSGTIAIGFGIVADISSSAERGTYMGWVTSGPMIGPAIGPVLGGILSQFLGWRSIFWFLAIAAVVYLIPFLITFPETGRNVVGNGSVPPPKWNMSLLDYLKERKIENSEDLHRTPSREEKRAAQADLARKRHLRCPNPLKAIAIILEKDVGILLFYNSLVYTAFYTISASAPSLFAEIYHFNDLQIGLSFIPFGVGCAIAAIAGGKLIDWNFKRIAHSHGIPIDKFTRGGNNNNNNDLRDFPIEKARIQIIWPLLYVGIAAILAYGWTLDRAAPLAAPLILQFVVGVTLTASFNVLSTMLVDFYPQSPATATAANNLVRCWMGAAGTAVIIQMIEAMGRGWCFTFIAAVVFLASPCLWVLTRFGPGWREERRVRLERRVVDKKEEEERKKGVGVGGGGGGAGDLTNVEDVVDEEKEMEEKEKEKDIKS
ncbi:hypothetical protein MMC09_000778 [Bachmanniomyces sp. S44760]|nr:hypothetical protein [Bachmanniomyces sp. S44760]